MNYDRYNFNESVSKVKREIIEIKNDEGDMIANDSKNSYPKILYFTAKWCGPCQHIQPIYKEFAEKNISANFFKIDVDENSEISQHFHVQSMPTFFFFKSKTDYKTFSGADVNKLNQHMAWVLG
jgi:thioredoxin 1